MPLKHLASLSASIFFSMQLPTSAQQLHSIAPQTYDQLKIDTFNQLPPDIEGGACYFFLAIKDKQQEKYIFVNDMAQYGFLSIGHKFIKFKLIQHDSKKNIFYYSNLTEKLKLSITLTKGTGETMQGKLELTGPSGNKLVKDIIGECGC